MPSRFLAFAVACLLPAFMPAALAQPVIMHAHGIAFSANGRQIFVPHQEGLAVFERGAWVRWPGPKHDFVGFAATRDAMFASGVPDPKSRQPNPLGLLRSRDGGMTWDRLGMQGESNFRHVAAGWISNVVYVWNPARNWGMPTAGLHHTLDEGRSWRRSRSLELSGEVASIAVHPRDARNVAVATSAGVFLSRDSGDRFANIAPKLQGFSVFFDLDARRLWYGAFDTRARLWRAFIADGKAEEVSLPPLSAPDRDGVAFMAQSPVDRAMYAIVTFRRDVYVTKDAGKSWVAIAREGAAIQ